MREHGRPTRIRVDAGACTTDLAPGEFLTPRVLTRHGRAARVSLVSHQAMLLAGDHLRLQIEVGPGGHLELTEPAGTIAYSARGGHAGWSARVHVEAGGSLVWRSAPMVLAEGCDVDREIELTLDEGAVAACHETLVLGRHDEPGGALLSRTRVVHEGRPLLVETLDLRDVAARATPGVLGDQRVIATALLLGLPIDAGVGAHVTPLEGAGVMARAVDTRAHAAEAVLEETWEEWVGRIDRHFAADGLAS